MFNPYSFVVKQLTKEYSVPYVHLPLKDVCTKLHYPNDVRKFVFNLGDNKALHLDVDNNVATIEVSVNNNTYLKLSGTVRTLVLKLQGVSAIVDITELERINYTRVDSHKHHGYQNTVVTTKTW